MLSTVPISLSILRTAYNKQDNKKSIPTGGTKHNLSITFGKKIPPSSRKKTENEIMLLSIYLISSTMKRTIQCSNSPSKCSVYINTTAETARYVKRV